MAYLDKGHPTARTGTHEGLLPGVQPPVVVQSVPLCELTLTELAGILLYTSVHVHVVLKTGNPVEPLAALFANKWFDVGMFHCVKFQLAAIVEHCITVFAGELLADLRIVNVELVLLSKSFSWELFGTVAAHHCRAALSVLAALVDLKEVLGLEDGIALVALVRHLLLELDLVLGSLHLVAPVDPLLVEV